MSMQVRVVIAERETLYRQLADSLVQVLGQTPTERERAMLALSGGQTPQPLYRLLAGEPYRNAIDWQRVCFFWADERYVPPTDPTSNFRMAYELWLREWQLPQHCLHPMPTYLPDPDEAARRYEAHLRQFFATRARFPQFDLILLGMGEDGHTASLFPEDAALGETTRWVAPARAPVPPYQRLTLTLPVLNAARRVWFLITGERKREALRRVFKTDRHEPPLPAARVKPKHGELIWWVEEVLRDAIPPRYLPEEANS
jgi:6-phosphogluconolactonase